MKQVFYKTQGTCSQFIEITADDNRIIQDVHILGGCAGKLAGICTLIKGKPLSEVREKLSGIPCGNKPTSCPDQISRAIAELEKQYSNQFRYNKKYRGHPWKDVPYSIPIMVSLIGLICYHCQEHRQFCAYKALSSNHEPDRNTYAGQIRPVFQQRLYELRQ